MSEKQRFDWKRSSLDPKMFEVFDRSVSNTVPIAYAKDLGVAEMITDALEDYHADGTLYEQLFGK